MAFVDVCGVEDVPAPGVAGRVLDGVPIAVVHAEDGNWYAINDICTHGEVNLSEGDLEGCELECWGHGGRFDIRTGAATALPAIEPVASYPVTVEGQRVLVDVKKEK